MKKKGESGAWWRVPHGSVQVARTARFEGHRLKMHSLYIINEVRITMRGIHGRVLGVEKPPIEFKLFPQQADTKDDAQRVIWRPCKSSRWK